MRRVGQAWRGGRPRHAGRARALAVSLAGMGLSGCGKAPSVVLFGAAFPDWLFCMAAGVIATVIVHLLLGAKKRTALLSPPALSYPALTAAFAVLFWLIVFYQ